MNALQTIIEQAWEKQSFAARRKIQLQLLEVIALLDAGKLRC
jgi:hypothetical protein